MGTEPDGKLAIPTSIRILNNVNLFRNQRASFEVFKVAMFVSDLTLKKLVINDLEKILLTSGQTRIDALNNLMVTVAGSSSSRYEIFQALRFLTNESGYKNNPFLMIAVARTQVFVNNTSFGNPVYDQSLIANAVKSANDNLYSSNPKINNLEAATINQIAGRLYDEVHANNKATNRRWIDRFLSMSNAERNSLKEGDIISIAQPDVNSVRGLFESESRLAKKDQEMLDTRTMWGESTPSDVSNSDHRTSEYFQKPTDVYATSSKYIATRDKQHSIMKVGSKFKSVYDNVQGDGYSSVAGLALEEAKWIATAKKMEIITKYLAERDRLLARVKLDNFHIIPPRPELIEQYIKDLRQYGTISANPFQKTRVVGVLSKLEGLLEESYAFYRSNK